MLANIGNQINTESVGLIADNGEVLGLPGKALSHAVVSGISADLGEVLYQFRPLIINITHRAGNRLQFELVC
ncbi:TPA: DUF637 domain-containing protein [Klebsiella pneumoniae]|nr:DUF637 domain-containing protein [Klebsiella pneumoniae]